MDNREVEVKLSLSEKDRVSLESTLDSCFDRSKPHGDKYVTDRFWDISSDSMEAFIRDRWGDYELKIQTGDVQDRIEIPLPQLLVGREPDYFVGKKYSLWFYPEYECVISVYHVRELDQWFAEIESQRNNIFDIEEIIKEFGLEHLKVVNKSLFAMVKEQSRNLRVAK